jgi:hypothetical protein
MAFIESERTDIRRYCGYPAYGAGNAGYQGWRFYQVYGLMEYRISNLTGSEEQVVRTYLTTLGQLEIAIPAAAANLDTDRAAVWQHNADEVRERSNLFDDWRRRLCAFLGLPPGPGLGDGGIALVV